MPKAFAIFVVIVAGLTAINLGVECIKTKVIDINKAIQPNNSKANNTYFLASTFTENIIK